VGRVGRSILDVMLEIVGLLFLDVGVFLVVGVFGIFV